MCVPEEQDSILVVPLGVVQGQGSWTGGPGLHGCVIFDFDGHPHDCVDLGGARTLEVALVKKSDLMQKSVS